jgi:hypothetical protein
MRQRLKARAQSPLVPYDRSLAGVQRLPGEDRPGDPPRGALAPVGVWRSSVYFDLDRERAFADVGLTPEADVADPAG